MKLFAVDLDEWNINQNVLVDFDEDLSLEELIEDLVEDLYQIKYKKNKSYVIDLGWYHELDLENGHFHLYVIKDENWDEPEVILKTRDIKELNSLMKECINYVKSVG